MKCITKFSIALIFPTTFCHFFKHRTSLREISTITSKQPEISWQSVTVAMESYQSCITDYFS